VTDESVAIYERYLSEAREYKNIFLCGRLAEFRYYNMDVCIEHALDRFEVIREYLLSDHE
jgi:UDP-galactopyranose mutase